MANSETLRDLIRINNDRVTGYSKAATQTEDQDLQSLFSQLAQQSRQFGSDLRRLISISDKDVTDETTTAGKIYRAWMDVKATFGGDDRQGHEVQILDRSDGEEQLDAGRADRRGLRQVRRRRLRQPAGDDGQIGHGLTGPFMRMPG